ncbi:MAG: patatin-like phospholipase family protein, partial [Leptospiraceae bacterium]|nr:patatin-like phospholipase family protein [Leptospiraceae bacterium]
AILDSYLWTLPATKFESLLEKIPSLAITAARHVSMNLQSSLSGLRNESTRVQTSNIHCIMIPEASLMKQVGAKLQATLFEQAGGDCLLVTAHGEYRRGTEFEFQPQPTRHSDGTKTLYRLDLPGFENQLSVEAFALWLRTESKKYSSVIILFCQGSTPFRSHLLGISRRSITFVRDAIPEFLPHLKGGRDLLYLVERGHSGTVRFKSLYQSAPDTLAPRSIQEDSLLQEIQNAIRRLIGVTIGIAFGGGGARGSAHIGVLRVLEQAGLRFDAVSGTSAGASIAAAVAMGKSSAEIQTFFEKNLFGGGHPFSDYTLPIRSLSKGKKVRNIFQKYFGDMAVRHTKIPFFPVTTNMMNGQEVALKDCDIWKAVFASGAAPGLLPLVRINEDWYGDGGLVNNVPASHLKAFGIDIVISVNISVDPARTPFATNYKIGNAIQRSMVILMDQSVARHLDYTDLEICPPVEEYRVTDFASGPAIMKIGIEAAENSLPRLQLLLKQRNWKP